MNKLIERKPRANCLLKNLAPARQQALYEFMEGVGNEKGHSYAECIAWLAKDGLETSRSKLSDWRSWYSLRLCFQLCRDITTALMEDDKKPDQKYSDEDIQRKGDRIFSLLALKASDDKAWSRVRRVQVSQQAVTATEKKLELEYTKYADQRAKIKVVESDTVMTPEEKEERIRQILGTD
jgi:hypothetical protein